MKEFIKFHKLRRLNNFQNIKFGKGIILYILISLINNYFFPENDNFFFFLFQMIVIISAVVFIFDSEFEEDVSLSTTYPMSYRRRKIYNILYALLLSIGTILILVLFFSTLDLIGSILFKNRESSGVVDDMSYTLYHAVFNLSLLSFYYFLSSIKDTKKWWFTLLIGNIGYFIINILSRYVVYGDLFVKKSIMLNDYTNNRINIYYFSVTILFIISTITFILINIKNTKVKKEIN